MMTCRELVEQLLDFVNEDLPPEIRQGLEEHLKQCPPCTFYVQSYMITLTISHNLPLPEMPAEAAERIQAAMKRATQSEA